MTTITFVLETLLILAAMMAIAWIAIGCTRRGERTGPVFLAVLFTVMTIGSHYAPSNVNEVDAQLASCGFGGIGGVFAGFGAVPGNGIVMGGDGGTSEGIARPIGGTRDATGYRPTGMGIPRYSRGGSTR
jgi:hypothetical protein